MANTHNPAGLFEGPTYELLDKLFDSPYMREWRWVRSGRPESVAIWVPTAATVFYLLSIYILRAFIQKRGTINVRPLARWHNLFLSIASAIMTVAMCYNLHKAQVIAGAQTFFCDEGGDQVERTSLYFWFWVFYLSKMYEFVDSWLQVCLGKELIFLHKWHHITTLWLVWVEVEWEMCVQWLPSISNTIVHTLMYWYYFLRSLKIEPWWKQHLTKLQMAQFAVTLSSVYYYQWLVRVEGRSCWKHDDHVVPYWFGQFIIGSFLVLFYNFYRQTYKSKKGTKGGKGKKSN